MNLLKFLFYFILAFLIVRFLLRIMYPPKPKQQQQSNRMKENTSESLEKPKIRIEAESVEYEIIEEPKKKNEE